MSWLLSVLLLVLVAVLGAAAVAWLRYRRPPRG